MMRALAHAAIGERAYLLKVTTDNRGLDE